MKWNLLLHLTLTVELVVEAYVPNQIFAAEQGRSAKAKGRIITCAIDPGTSSPDSRREIHSCSRSVGTFFESAQGGWSIQFNAFLRVPLPRRRLGVVILSASQNPVALMLIRGKKGQTRLLERISVFYTDTPNRPHLLKVYYLKERKAIELASTQVWLGKKENPKYLYQSGKQSNSGGSPAK